MGILVDRLAGDGFIGFVDPDRRAKATYRVTRDRLDGFAAGLAEAGIAFESVVVLERPSNRRDLGRTGAAGAFWIARPT